MATDYDILATVYNELEMGAFAYQMAPKLFDYAQRNNWMGRQILDLGCGTGTGMEWLGQHGYIITGIDQNAAMLHIAKQTYSAKGFNFTWLKHDIRESFPVPPTDLALSLDVMNELDSLRELEIVLQNVFINLKSDKLFIFDMYTIEGLVGRGVGDHLTYERADLNIFTQNDFDYERHIQTRRFIIFRKHHADWTRTEAQRILRAYPVQAIGALIQRTGFTLNTVLDTSLNPYDPTKSRSNRVFFVAQKRG